MDPSGRRSLLHYTLVEKIGAGGMGEVWRASDTTLDRDVAIKLLPPELANDPERLARFEREAKVLASLNHPRIAGIYGIHAADGQRFLAMEFIPGEELAERIARGPIPVPDAIEIAIQITTALEYAHERGIIHRDLKPANVMLTSETQAKVLDFGLAKALDDGVAAAGAAPTITSAGTRMGTILGTAAYMSPEQARGQTVDRRTDIWAFGCILYEMLTGRRAFEGETASDTLAAVLRHDIDWSTLPATVPVELRRVLQRCLVRDQRDRFHDIADIRLLLGDARDALRVSSPVPSSNLPTARPRTVLPWVAGALLLGGLAGALLSGVSTSSKNTTAAPNLPTSFRPLTSLAGGEFDPALAPDGQSFAYVRLQGVQTDVFVQRVDGRNSINLTTDCLADDAQPAFSPDGRLIAFRSERQGGGVFVMGATGENVRRVADFGFNPAWSPDGRELAVVTEELGIPWARTTESRLWAVDVESGARRLVSDHDAMQPSWSPDGRHIVFWGLDRTASQSQRDLWTVRSDGSAAPHEAAVQLLDDPHLDWSPLWAPDGRTVYFSSSRGGTINLWQLSVDPQTGASRGAPQPITAPSSWVGWLSASGAGDRLAFVDRNARTMVHRAHFDAARAAIDGPIHTIPLGTAEVYEHIELTPDGQGVLFSNAGLPQHLFLARADGSGIRQLTDGEHRDRQAVFSPDGQWIAFQTNRFPSTLGLLRTDGSGLRPVPLERTNTRWWPVWSADGKRLAVGSESGAFVIEVDPNGQDAAIHPLPAIGSELAFLPTAWSDDGTTVAGETTNSANSSVGAALYSMRDGKLRVVFDGGRGTARSHILPDNRSLVSTRDDRLVVHDLVSGAARTLLTAPAGHFYGDVTVSRDGQWIAFLEIWDESDIWMATLAPPRDTPER